MKYCQNCGKPIHEAARFCESCGYEQLPCQKSAVPDKQESKPSAAQPALMYTAEKSRKIHCPVCRSSNLQAIIKNQTTDGGGVAVPVGRLFALGLSDTKTEYEYEWLCQDCGHRFPQIQELKKKLSKKNFELVLCIVCLLVAIAVTGYVLAVDYKSALSITISCIFIFAALIIYTVLCKNKLTEDIYYYHTRCYYGTKE